MGFGGGGGGGDGGGERPLGSLQGKALNGNDGFMLEVEEDKLGGGLGFGVEFDTN